MQLSRRRIPRRRRPGFTLVELMVVIVIIGILVALLLPVIVGAIRKANEARISADIQTLASGLASFKNTYGEYPPSRVVLSETGNYSAQSSVTISNGGVNIPVSGDFSTSLSGVSSWYLGGGTTGSLPATNFGTPDISFGELANRSLRALRRYFPRGFLGPVVVNGTTTYWPDYNGNANQDPGFILLEGYECLVFFLGGIPSPTANADGSISYGMSGFGRHPQFVFTNAIASTNRTNPLYEFQPNRLLDDDGDGIPGYIDTQGTGADSRFYAYFAAYPGVGYDPNDCNGAELDDSGNTVGTYFRIGSPLVPASTPNATTYSPAPNPYTSSLPTPVSGASAFDPNQPASYINASSFQIISAGGDRYFGAGGQYQAGSQTPLPDYFTTFGTLFAVPQGLRSRESDNITSFSQSRLD